MRQYIAISTLCLASCALGDATFGDRFEALDAAFVSDKVERNTWTLQSANADLTTAHQICGQIPRTCGSYWRLPTEREWADVLDLSTYLNSADDVRPDEPTLPEALDLEPAKFWHVIIAERPSEAYIGSSGHLVIPATGVGEDAASTEMHLTRCICTEAE